MRNSKLVPLYRQLADLIEQEIVANGFAAGAKLQSTREICERFSVSDVTAKKALRLLRGNGVVKTVAGSGVFVADREVDGKSAKKTALVALLKEGLHPAPIFNYGIDLIQQELQRLGYSMVYSVAETSEKVTESLNQIKASGAQCLLFFPHHKGAVFQDRERKDIRLSSLPTLVLESRSIGLNYVTADMERGTALLADYLYGIGHRRICLATAFSRKVAGFEQAVARWNDPGVQKWILAEEGKTDEDDRDLARRILALTPRPTAVIASDDHAAAILISAFLASGVTVPGEISVATFDDHPKLSQYSSIPLTVVRHPCREIAQEVACWVHAQFNNAGNRRFRRDITGTLIQRESTAAPVAQRGQSGLRHEPSKDDSIAAK